MRTALLLSLVTVGIACGPPVLELPEDPAALGAPVGTRTLTARGITFSVFYPAPDAVARQTAGVVDLTDFMPAEFLEVVGPFDAPQVNLRAVLDADVRRPPTELEGGWPVIVFSHGFGGFRYQSVDHVVHLASRGYVVVSPDHPGRMLGDILPCLFDPPLEGCDLSQLGVDPAPEQLTQVLGWVDAAATEANGFLAGLINPGRLGLSGHSAGAASIGEIFDGDPRVQAVLMMGGGAVVTGDAPPVVLLAGTCDAIIPIETLNAAAADMGAPIVRIQRAGHLAFSEICDLDLTGFATTLLGQRDDVNDFFLARLLTLAADGCPGKEPEPPPADCVDTTYLPLEKSSEIIRHYSARFFDAQLKDTGPGLADAFPDDVEIGRP